MSTASDVYGRVWIYVKSQTSNATLAGFRSTSLIASINLGTDKLLNVVVAGGSNADEHGRADPECLARARIPLRLRGDPVERSLA